MGLQVYGPKKGGATARHQAVGIGAIGSPGES